MSNFKLMQYGISNDDGVIAINSALKTFVECVRERDEVPKHLLEFVADGVERYLKGSTKPWSEKRDLAAHNASKYGLVLALIERGVKRIDIATHLGISENRVSEIIKKPLQLKDSTFDLRRLYKAIWLEEFKEKEVKYMLLELEGYRKSKN